MRWLLLVVPVVFYAMPAPARASCSGLRDEALVECQEAEAQMIRRARENAKAAEKVTLHYRFRGVVFTITARALWGDFDADICQAKRLPGVYEQIDPKTKQAFEVTTCARVSSGHPRQANIARHGLYKEPATEGNYWCGNRVGPWRVRQSDGSMRTEELTINDFQADCDASALALKLVKIAADRWTLK